MRKKVPCNFHSILAPEFYDYINYREANGHNGKEDRYIIRKLDSFLSETGLSEKRLDAEILDAWLNSIPVGHNTKCHYTAVLRQLAQYLCGMGIPAYSPDSMKIKRCYTPYVLSHDEIQRVFDACDNMKYRNVTNAALWFPVMVRMLYGCGLRIGEATALRIKDIDWENKTLIIRAAKGNKDRLVPMSDSLCQICASYYAIFHSMPKADDYFFHNRKGERFPSLTPYMWLRKAYDAAGINRLPDPTQAHGVSTHTLRHSFAVHVLQQQSEAGIDRFYAIPILSTYMGHNDIYGTELYLQLTPEYHETLIRRTESYVGNIFPEVQK